MEEASKISIKYKKEEYEINEQELERLLALSSKKLRNEIIASRLGFGGLAYLSKGSLEANTSEVKVLKEGYESNLYQAMSESLIYALEQGYLDNYLISEGQSPEEPEVLEYSLAEAEYNRNNLIVSLMHG